VSSAYDQLYALDGYHPVSLVLNCGDYHFRPYTKGTDIVLVDPYPFNNDKHWSSQYGTVCNSTYGEVDARPSRFSPGALTANLPPPDRRLRVRQLL
jgi:hypothetical protein